MGVLTRITLLLGIFALGAVGASGCQTQPERADRFVIDPGFPTHWGKAALFYVPSRIMDLLDVVHVGIGVGPGLGAELQLTRPASLGAAFGADVGVAWLGRNTNPFQAAVYARANAVEYRALAKKGSVWRIPFWDIGVRLHNPMDDRYLGFAVDEFVDLIAGLIMLDLKHDDFGCDRPDPPQPELNSSLPASGPSDGPTIGGPVRTLISQRKPRG